jgi:catalase
MNTLLNSAGTESTPSPEAMVDALNNTFGKHAGKRASHAKGFCATGTLTSDVGAARFANSEFFKADTAAAVVRFSVGGGNPGVSDKSRTVRGMGLKMTAGGEHWDLVVVSEPVFFAATPESFVSFLEARVVDPVTKKPNPANVAAHNEKFPDGKLQPALLASHSAPSSYAHTPYFSNNAFVFHNADGEKVTARLIVEPVQGTKYLTEEEEANFPDNFLEAELSARLKVEEVKFVISALLPAPGDSLTDPSQQWHGEEKIVLGTLRVDGMAPVEACDNLVFSPFNLPASITPSSDPILASRDKPYGISFERRQPAPCC